MVRELKEGQKAFGLVLEGDLLNCVYAVKAYHGLSTYTEAIRLIIKKYADNYLDVLD